ncbi:serine/threonine-protein kinase NIM1-like protein [Leptotrombidium deliense]|uniref:Serine/threonine-protein kinase NIM1-like protein n=1 Tax=Leptotrombidium deliense TaxID=299467 RepID=A0A443RYP8_9ACAR|nr:serine/threonine-protein kinase NIM1-like protein [Leptotrombidium deliense]
MATKVVSNIVKSANISSPQRFCFLLETEKVAIKILDRSKLDTKTQRMLNREISSMEKLHHPNVVRLFEVIETFSKIYLVMEIATGGELFQKITTQGKAEEEEGKVLFAQIVAAVEHMVSITHFCMHRHNITEMHTNSIRCPPHLIDYVMCSQSS